MICLVKRVHKSIETELREPIQRDIHGEFFWICTDPGCIVKWSLLFWFICYQWSDLFSSKDNDWLSNYMGGGGVYTSYMGFTCMVIWSLCNNGFCARYLYTDIPLASTLISLSLSLSLSRFFFFFFFAGVPRVVLVSVDFVTFCRWLILFWVHCMYYGWFLGVILLHLNVIFVTPYFRIGYDS